MHEKSGLSVHCPAKNDEPAEMPFWGPRYRILVGGGHPLWDPLGMGNFFMGGMCQLIVKYTNYAVLCCGCIVPAAEYLKPSAVGAGHTK